MTATQKIDSNNFQLGILGDELLVKIFRELELNKESDKILLRAIAKVLASRKKLYLLMVN